MKKILLTGLLIGALIACNKQKKLMKGLVGNWKIEKSERAVIHSDGTEDYYESITNAGELVIFEDPNNESAETKQFTFDYTGPDGNPMHIESVLATDEKNTRLVFEHALCDSTSFCDVIWTIDKTKKNKQIWSAYGVDTTFYYPTNKFNPGSANNWLMWRITLKREHSGSGS